MFFRWLKWPVLIVLIGSLLLLRSDVLHLNPVERQASPYLYGLVEWEASNFLSKWLHKVTNWFPWNADSREERRQKIDEYFLLGDRIRELRHQIDRSAAQAGGGRSAEVLELEEELSVIEGQRDDLRNDVEEFLESAISSVLSDLGFSSRIGIMFPPVDFRLEQPPKLLVTSPRDRIVRTHDVLLRPGIKVEQIEGLEEDVLQEQNLSALVIDIGGVATYPSTIPDTRDLQGTLITASHEWLHQFWFFRDLGQHFSDSADMASLNETAADIAGRELGSLAFERLVGKLEEPQPPVRPQAEASPAEGEEESGFDFNREMHKTRLRVDELLAEGKVEEAEAYMEERRQLFLENGFFIRKLNQAYFAFHGTYAESPASVSPIGNQLNEFRSLLPDVGTFVKEMARVSSYQEFLELLDELRGCERIPCWR